MTALQHRLAIAAAALALGGCSAPRPLFVQPPGLERDAETHAIRGLRGGNSGYFALAGHVGGFARGPDALTAAGFTDLRPGSVAFDIAGPELPGAIEAVCDADAQTVAGAGPPDAGEAPAMLHCDFALDGGPTDWRLALERAPGDARQSRGEIALDAAALVLRSGPRSGDAQGGDGPIAGYAMEGPDGAVASLDLSVEPPLLRLSSRATPPQRRAAIVAAAGLSALAGPSPARR